MARTMRTPVSRCVIEIPQEVGTEVDAFAERVNFSRNKAAAALLRLGLKAEAERYERLRKLTEEIRQAPTDEEAGRYGDELIELVFGRQKEKEPAKAMSGGKGR